MLINDFHKKINFVYVYLLCLELIFAHKWPFLLYFLSPYNESSVKKGSLTLKFDSSNNEVNGQSHIFFLHHFLTHKGFYLKTSSNLILLSPDPIYVHCKEKKNLSIVSS